MTITLCEVHITHPDQPDGMSQIGTYRGIVFTFQGGVGAWAKFVCGDWWIVLDAKPGVTVQDIKEKHPEVVFCKKCFENYEEE